MSTLLLRETGSSPGSTVKGAPLTNAEIDRNLDNLNKSLFDSVYDANVFSANIVKTFIYDTTKDSDGGEWRKRCSHTSWENETLSGNWLGSAANETAARAISGATTGSYYYDTTAAAFYTLNAGSGKTATYRGNVRQFPAQVLITVEAARVVLWDLTQAGCPMWKVFTQANNYPATAAWNHTAVSALNGIVSVVANSTYGFLMELSFIADYSDASRGFTSDAYTGKVPGLTAVSSRTTAARGTKALASERANDVAMTVLPNAPVDVATGLPVPTIAVATAGGVSVIKDNGTVWDFVVATYPAKHVWFDAATPKRLFSTHATSVAFTDCQLEVIDIPSSDVTHTTATNRQVYDIATTPAILGDVYAAGVKGVAIGASIGVTRIRRNDAAIASGMVAYITKDYNSGWQVGAIKGAWLADTVVETLTGTELVTNGTFATDATGWTASNLTGSVATLSIASGRLRVTNNAAGGRGAAYQSITTVVGKTYAVTITGYAGTASTMQARIGTTIGGFEYTAMSLVDGVPQTAYFVATSTTLIVMVDEVNGTASQYVEFDNISCRLADVDRSVKAKGLQAFGSLTKAAVASGAALMGYSGFSAANYLEQPYNSDLDFGTGDFCVMGWSKFVTLDWQGSFDRATTKTTFTTDLGVRGYVNGGTGVFVALAGNGAAAVTVSTASTVVGIGWAFYVVIRASGVLYLYQNGILIGSAACTYNLTSATATFSIGGFWNAGAFGSRSDAIHALWRVSATAPSAEQIKHIYETERPMFAASANCCLAGTSNAVTALAYDDETDLLHVGTSYGRSTFKGLVRTSSEATAVGSITALSASGGIIAQGGATAVDIYVPSYNLREELLRDAEQAAKFGSALVATRFTATSSQTTFQLPVGYEIEIVYRNGLLLWPGSTEDYTTTFDGFRWSVVLADASIVGDQVTVMGVRRNG